MTNQKSSGTIWTWVRTGWSWLRLVTEAAIALIWLITIASALSGDWPAPTLWIMLMGVTGMLVSRRIQATYPKLSEPLFIVATIVMMVALFGFRRE